MSPSVLRKRGKYAIDAHAWASLCAQSICEGLIALCFPALLSLVPHRDAVQVHGPFRKLRRTMLRFPEFHLQFRMAYFFICSVLTRNILPVSNPRNGINNLFPASKFHIGPPIVNLSGGRLREQPKLPP